MNAIYFTCIQSKPFSEGSSYPLVMSPATTSDEAQPLGNREILHDSAVIRPSPMQVAKAITGVPLEIE